MSEQQRLLSPGNDPEVGTDGEDSKPVRWRERMGELLESRRLHKAVITLIAIDGACVLADLGYAFLSDTCTPPEGPEAPTWLEVLATISIVITTFFLVEIPLTLWAFGPRFYNSFGSIPHASLHLFDAVIIITTFVLEVVLKGKERELAELLILLRLWRLVKLVGGIAVGAGELEEENAEELMRTKEKLEETTTALTTARDENNLLRDRISRLENGEN